MKTIIKAKITMYFNEMKNNRASKRLVIIRAFLYIIIMASLITVINNSNKSFPKEQIDMMISLLPAAIVLFLSCMLLTKPNMKLLKDADVYNIAIQGLSKSQVVLYICFTNFIATLKVALISMMPMFFFTEKIKTWPTTVLLTILIVNILIYFIFVLLAQTLTLISIRDRKKELLKIFSFISLFVMVVLIIFLREQDNIDTNILVKLFNNEKFYYIPIIGWGKAVIWGGNIGYIYLGCFVLLILIQLIIFYRLFSINKLLIEKIHATNNSKLFLNLLNKLKVEGNNSIVKKNLLVDSRMEKILNFGYYNVGFIALIIFKMFNLPLSLISIYLIYIYIFNMTSSNFNHDFKNIYIYMNKSNIRNKLLFIIGPFYIINVLRVSIILSIGGWFLYTDPIYIFGQLVSYFAIILLVHTFVKINFSDSNGNYNNSILFGVYIVIAFFQYIVRIILTFFFHLSNQIEFNFIFPFIEICFLFLLIKLYKKEKNSLY